MLRTIAMNCIFACKVHEIAQQYVKEQLQLDTDLLQAPALTINKNQNQNDTCQAPV